MDMTDGRWDSGDERRSGVAPPHPLADEPGRTAAGGAFVPPRTPAERAIARIWAEALWVERVGPHDDFFDLGGDSLTATRVALALGSEFGVEVTVKTLFAHPTVEALAELVTATRRTGAEPAATTDRAATAGPAA
jgi:acyl carrier protein